MDDLCNGCQRKGLAIFPALYAAAPKDIASLVPPVGNHGKGVNSISLQDSKYFLRSLPEGYLYLLYPNKIWRGYLVDPEGAMLYYPSLTKEDMPDQPPAVPLKKTCKRQAHNSLAIQSFTIESPNDIGGVVWAAFSRHKWDKNVRKKIAENPAKRMQAIQKLDGKAFDHAEMANAGMLKTRIANFNPGLVKQLNEYLPDSLDLVDLSGREEEIAQRMLAHSGSLKLPGLILALHDPIGITASLNARRNTARAAEVEYDKQYEREIFSSSAVRSLEAQAGKNPQLGEKWASTYQNAVSWDTLETFETNLKSKREEFSGSIDTAAEDWIKWNLSDALQNVMDLDFGCSMQDSHDFRCAAVWTASGVGDGKAEREQWLPVAIDPDNERNYLWRATILNQPDLAAFLKSAGNQPTEYNAAKWLYSSLDQWLAKQERLAQLNQLQTAGLISPYGRQTHTAAYNRLLLALQMLQGAAKDKALRFTRATLLCAYLYGVELLPVKIEETVKRIVGMQREVIWKPVGSFFEVEKLTTTHTRWRVDVSQLMQAADVQVTAKIAVTQYVITRTREGTVWRPTELFKPYELTLQNPNLPSPQGTPSHTPKVPGGPGVGTRIGGTLKRGMENMADASRNWWAANRELVTKMVSNPYVGGSISSVALVFQAYSFNSAYQSLTALKHPTSREIKNARAAMASAAIASIGFSIEIVAAATQVAGKKAAQKAGEEALKALAKRVGMIAGVGELVGAASGFVGVWQLEIAKDSLVAAGDLDAARYTAKQQIALGVASFASSIAGGTMVASALTQTSITFLGMGPVGWLLLAAGFTVALIWAVYETEKSRDDPLESWLKQCAFGEYRNTEWTGAMEQERYGKIFAIDWSVDLEWKVEKPMLGGLDLQLSSFKEIFKLRSQVGQVSEHAVLAADIRFFHQSGVVDIMAVIGPNGLQTEIRPPKMTSRYGGEGAHVWGKAEDGLLKANVEFQQRVPNPVGRLGLKLPADKTICTRVEVKLRYWPDQLNQPEAILPSDAGRIDRLSYPAAAFLKKAVEEKAAAEKRAAECVAAGRCVPMYGNLK